MGKTKGIDVSYWQGNIDFNKVVKDEIDFVILREGYRQTIDEKFLQYVQQCKKSELPIVGVYHFLYSLNETDAINEAKNCIKNVKNANLNKDTIIFADFEYDTVKKAKEKGIKLGKKECIAHTKAFCQEVEKQGYKAGIYTNTDYYINMYDKTLLDKYILWLADYSGDPDYPCNFQQYTSSGKVNGISGNVDMNYHYTTIDVKKEDKMSNIDFTKYKNMISNSGGDEYGNIYGGAAGDQTKGEWNVRSWYNRPWFCILRHPKQEVRELIAELSIEAANNDKVGYDQYQRNTYWEQLQKVGYRPSKITVACESDCSAGVIANTKAVGNLLNLSALKNISATYTGNMREAYKNAGFQILTDSKYLTSSDYLLPGDILLNDLHHTATNLGIGSKVSYSVNTKKTVQELAKEVIAGLWGTGDERIKNLTEAGYNYTDIQNQVNNLLGVKTMATTNAQKILNAAREMTDIMLTDIKSGIKWLYYNSGTKGTFEQSRSAKNYRCNCALFCRWAMKRAKLVPNNMNNLYGKKGKIVWGKGVEEIVKKAFDVIYIGNKTVKTAMSDGTLKPGDIVMYMDLNHTNLYAGNKRFYDAGHAGCKESSGEGATFITWYTNKDTPFINYKISYIIRAKENTNDSKEDNTPIKKISTDATANFFDKTIAGKYQTSKKLNMRYNAGMDQKVLCIIPENTTVNCYGYYNISNNIKWYLIQFTHTDGIQYTGFSSSRYLKKV